MFEEKLNLVASSGMLRVENVAFKIISLPTNWTYQLVTIVSCFYCVHKYDLLLSFTAASVVQ